MFIVKQNIALNQTVTIVSCYCGLLFHNITFYCTMSRSYMTEALRGSCADFVKWMLLIANSISLFAVSRCAYSLPDS